MTKTENCFHCGREIIGTDFAGVQVWFGKIDNKDTFCELNKNKWWHEPELTNED